MEVILLDRVENLGQLGDKVSVKAGYGRNYLIPKGKAMPATAKNLEKFKARRAELEASAAKALSDAETRRDAIAEQTFTIAHKAGEEGKLFGSVGTIDIATVISEAGTSIAKNEVRLPHGAIRQIGEYSIEIHLHAEVNAQINLHITAEE